MKILICPLNWGLGHATRCVPIIRKYITEGHQIVLAADGYPLEFLKQEFPELETIELPSYSIRYSAGNSQVVAMIRNLPNIVKGIYREHYWLQKLLKEQKFDLVISDNRFGLFTKQITCIYMTHQLMIKMPKWLKALEPLAWWLHRQVINRYNKCWIPDFPENQGLSGDLAHNYTLPRNAHFIGPQTRFLKPEKYTPDSTFDVVAIVSGIEPQRTLFEESIAKRFGKSTEKTLIVCGKPGDINQRIELDNLCFASHIPDTELAQYLIGCQKIIARSGYSTLMDLEALNCLQKAELIPTPGQTEQEYLAEYITIRESRS